jgi:hypothetical protein
LSLSVLFLILVVVVKGEQTAAKTLTALIGEVAERFGQRDAEKFKFLGE